MRRWLALVVALAAAIALIEWEAWLQAIGDFLVVNDPLERVDAIIAIGGGGPERVAIGVELWREGYGRWLIVSGGPYRLGPRSVAQNSAIVMRNHALASGVPADRILVDDDSESTLDNAQACARLMKAHGLRSATLVTSPYHTRRAGFVFARVFRSQGLEVRVHAAPSSFFEIHRWWSRHRDRNLVVQEYVKLLAFWGGVP